jgi:hypothetical protein
VRGREGTFSMAISGKARACLVASRFLREETLALEDILVSCEAIFSQVALL